MIECRTIEALRAWREKQESVGFVPTMGALHPGHLSLIPLVKMPHGATCVSIFVNPLQFGANEDLSRYPRPIEKDLSLLREIGVSCVFLPTVEEITPPQTVTVSSGALGRILEGSYRPGHFDGVATIVTKLFNTVQPSIAAFGLKDLQQCAVIRALVRDLNLPISLRFGATMRESDGLAMSSRNTYLSPAARSLAPKLFATLTELRSKLLEECDEPQQLFLRAKGELNTLGFAVDYLELVDGLTMLPSFDLKNAYLVAAVRFEDVRLIDNLAMDLEQDSA